MSEYHTSVFLKEAVEFLNIKPEGKYIDATLGGGGHAFEIAKRMGRVLGIDVDEEAITYAKSLLEDHKEKQRITLARGNFREIDRIAKENGFDEVDGIIFDLGVSSHQFGQEERGFSLQYEGPLDMRMDAALPVKAADLVNALTKKELVELFEKYGEERNARRIADAILVARSQEPIQTTRELAITIERISGRKEGKIHPATRVFQALRIVVNDELHALEEGLQKSLRLLATEARIVVISFHSLEDRIVKHTFNAWNKEGLGRAVTEKPLLPSREEMEKNRRSRSAKLRVFERI